MRLKTSILTIAAIAITAGAMIQQAGAQGFVREWTNPAGGEFHFPFNWADGVPFQDDDALFDLGGEFTVDLTADAEIRSLMIEKGNVRFLGGNNLTAADATIAGSFRIAGAGTVVDITGDVNLSTSLGMDRGGIIRDGATFRTGNTTVEGFGTSTIDLIVDDGGVWVADNLYLGTQTFMNLSVESLNVADGGRLNVGTENTIFDGITVGSADFEAELNVLAGSALGSSTTTIRIGLFAGNEGSVTIGGQGTDVDFSSLFVGNLGGIGTLTVRNGASLVTDTIDVGNGAGDTEGTMTVDDTIVFTGDVKVGAGVGGTGNLVLINGALLLGNDITIGQTDSVGMVSITDDAILSGDNLIIGDGGVADVSSTLGGAITAQEDVFVSENSTLYVSDSTLSVGDVLEVNGDMIFRDNAILILPPFGTAPITLIGSGKITTNNNSVSYVDDIENLGLEIQTLEGSARFDGNYSGLGNFTGGGIVEFNGEVDLGSGTAISTFEGHVELEPGSNLNVELGGVQAGQFDRMEIVGDLTLDDANLTMTTVGGFNLSTSQQFVIAAVGGAVTGQFNGLPEGSVVVSGGGNNLTITYSGGDGNDVALITTGFLAGDVNCDGTVNLLDVTPFIDLLSNGGFDSKADVNGDGVVDLLDVSPFIDVLSGG